MKKGIWKGSSNRVQIIIIILAGSAMIAHGLRMITQGLLYPQSIYPAPVPTSLDFWFDWVILLIFGICVFTIGFRQWIQSHWKTF